MLKFPGFSDVEKIHEGKRSTIFSATKDAQSVIIKYLNKENPTADDIVHYQYEYELLKDIDDVCFMRVLDFQLYENSCFIVMEDARMKSVEELLKDTQLDMKQKLNLALEMTKLLDRLYDRHIIHKSFTLSNILYDPDNSTVKLTNFASAITLSFEQNIFKNPHAQEGELCYYSPEHTGRMNRNVDYRSDFYSFGVCLYKLFCGVFPFEEENRLKLFHLIIASMAIPPHERLASIPTALSKIIMKLLEKNAEDRYQSVHGLRSDISRLIDKLGTGADVDFDVCQDDHTGVLHIPQKLFGREDEVKTLMGSFKRVSEGAKEILLVSGYSGVGKSVLVNEVHKPITKKQGFFIEGKFDQFQKDKPYLTMVQAFSTWIEHIMNEPKPEQERWKERLLHALGRNAQVIIELIPAFERLLGKQAPAETLSGIEAQNRFNFLFTSLVNCIASKEHPLVLFIDDLQWSDQATLNLIETLFLDAQSSYFLLFGAYRDNEVDETHPFIKSMEQMKKEGVTIGDLRIGNLTKEDVTGLLSETLDQSAERILELVDLIYEKTAGNAFFVNNFIEALYHEGLLCFDFDTQAWIWNIQAIRDKKLTDNVVDLMSKEISKFSGDTQKALTMAACIGNRFDLNTLSIISERTIKDLASDLSEALRRGLIIPLKEAYKYIDYTHDECNVVYKFAHDRIQQAAYSFLSEEGKPSVHLRIGKLLKENTKDEALDDKLFDIVNHMNIGASLILDKGLRQEMSVLNYKAALKAQKSVAFQASYDFLTFSLEYMDEHHWEDDYGLSYDAYLMKSEVSYMVQDFATSKVLIEEILCHAKTGVEKAKAQNVSVLRETMQGNYSEAIAFGREGMKNIGFSLPEDAYDENFGKDLHEINSYLQTHTISSLGDLPVCEEESVIVATALLMNMGPPTYMAFKPLYPIVCSRFVLLAINHGNTLYSSIAYSNYGIVLAAMMGQYDAGYEFGLVSLKVGKAFKNMQQVCKNSFMFATILNNWVHPIKMGDAINEEGYQIGIQSGDLQFVGYILFSKLLLSYVQGHALDEIKEKLPFSYRYQEKTHNKWAIDNIGALSFAVNRLKGEMPTLISEEEYLDSVSDDEGQSGLCFYKIFMAQVEFIFKNYEKSLALSEEAASILFNIYGFLPVLDNNYYHSLSCSMLALKKPRDERQEERPVWLDDR